MSNVTSGCIQECYPITGNYLDLTSSSFENKVLSPDEDVSLSSSSGVW